MNSAVQDLPRSQSLTGRQRHSWGRNTQLGIEERATGVWRVEMWLGTTLQALQEAVHIEGGTVCQRTAFGLLGMGICMVRGSQAFSPGDRAKMQLWAILF